MRIRPLLRSDIPAVLAISVAVFSGDELFVWLYPRQKEYPDDLRRFQLIRLRTRLVERGSLGFVMETEPGDAEWEGHGVVVGFEFVIRKGKDEAAGKWQSDPAVNKLERYLLGWEEWYEVKVLQHAADPEHGRIFRDSSRFSCYETLPDHWHLGLLGVSPEFQRRGIGAKLVEHGMNIARQENVPVTLQASLMGRGLYTKLGFKIIETSKMEGLPIEGVAMLWEPEQSKGRWLQEEEDGIAKLKAA